MRRTKIPPATLREWVEFYWLMVVNPAFRKAPHKRKAYFEYRLGKIYQSYWP
jgi:hypothetical protein